jgi:flavin reductase (DIM6/NTAB) family NADH-FMN oxidoreductase RutF
VFADELNALSLRSAFAGFPSGVVAACGVDAAGARIGMAMSTFVPVSLDPPLVGLCIQRSSRTWPQLRTLPSIGISVLGDGHYAAARQPAMKEGDRFGGLQTLKSDSGALFLAGASLWFDCEPEDEMVAGDHLIATLRVRGISDHGHAPLVFHRSDFARVASVGVGLARAGAPAAV